MTEGKGRREIPPKSPWREAVVSIRGQWGAAPHLLPSQKLAPPITSLPQDPPGHFSFKDISHDLLTQARGNKERVPTHPLQPPGPGGHLHLYLEPRGSGC